MKYLLVVGFSCDVYRKEPQARIFVGDKLIDEFYISPHKDTLTIVKKTFRQNMHVLQKFSSIEFLNTQIKNFPPLRFYEIEIEQKHNRLKLRIDIDNSDSNSNNGFITKSSLLKLQIFYFFPLDKKILSKLSKISEKNLITKNYAWYRSFRSFIFNNNMQWQGRNRQIVPANFDLDEYNIGGSGYFACELVKKYGIFIHLLRQSYRFLFNRLLVTYFFNKYQQHANQRNIN